VVEVTEAALEVAVDVDAGKPFLLGIFNTILDLNGCFFSLRKVI